MIFIYRFSSSFPFPLSPCTAKLPRQILYTFSSWISLISSFFSQSFFFFPWPHCHTRKFWLSPVKFSLDIALGWYNHPFSLAGSSFSFSPLCGWAFAPGFILNLSFPFTCCPGTALDTQPSPALICLISSSFIFSPASKTLTSRGLITSSQHVKKKVLISFQNWLYSPWLLCFCQHYLNSQPQLPLLHLIFFKIFIFA